MDNKCPKCNEKISLFYLKQNCPYCECDLVNYDLENRLEADAQKAEKEFEIIEGIINKVSSKFKKNKK